MSSTVLEYVFTFKYFDYDSNVAYSYKSMTPELEELVKEKVQYLSSSLSNLHHNPEWINYDRCERTRCGKTIEYNDKTYQVIVIHPSEY